ncbi:MAG: hypothetical protein LBR10_02255 [Prevotellaceae bacterium]|jgi:ABC-type cobalamin/Fe3+-siderophores transport system ATPase subunit|nr:hypothetical protein [Prevotellaceae bacterium]
MIKVIEIKNIKGIQYKKFELDIIPNKPSILVAPNGFGKSSLATAFKSMNNNRIHLQEDDYYKGDQTNSPQIKIEYKKSDEETVNLEATNEENSISSEIDYFVINNQLKPRGVGSRYGRATARLEIEDIILIDRIPQNVNFVFSVADLKDKFGCNGRVLPNIRDVFNNLKLVEKISEHYQDLQRANGQRIQESINSIIAKINTQQLAAQHLLKWIEDNCLNNLQRINNLNTIGDLINKFNIYPNSIVKSYLAAIQLIWIYHQNKTDFKKACTYKKYLLDKQQIDEVLSDFNCTWKKIRPSETHGKLVVKFPEATQISNGQRDILTFIAMLLRAKQKLKKSANILVIDEVFDYLDDANLIAAQYYITRFINDFKTNERCIYPLILTHLNPNYFKNYAFSDQKVYYLDKSTIQVKNNLIKLLRNRMHETIKEDVDKYLLHYNPNTINKRVAFRALQLPECWGEGENFINHLNEEIQQYLDDNTYDPFAVCGALRIKIEKIAFEQLQNEDARNEFLKTHKTRSKLEYVETKGIISPESHYLLGIIYNEGMHWKENIDNISPIASKLENLVIKNLIRNIIKQQNENKT